VVSNNDVTKTHNMLYICFLDALRSISLLTTLPPEGNSILFLACLNNIYLCIACKNYIQYFCSVQYSLIAIVGLEGRSHEKKLYHLCVSSPEVMFRVPEDYYQGINRACLAAYHHDAGLLAYSFMSNHFHVIVETENPFIYIGALRNGYSKWFNSKYSRKGPLGHQGFHAVELNTPEHILEGITYVLRNGVHHNVGSYPSGYPFCSTRYYFMKDFGVHGLYTPITSWKEQREFLSWKVKLPPGYVLDKSGMLIQENILQIKMVEHYYGSPRKFSYYMNKLSGEEWAMLHIESWMGTKAKELLNNEKITGKINRISDVDVCQFIDKWLKDNKKGAPYTTLLHKEKLRLAQLLWQKRAGPGQIARCLAISSDVLEYQENTQLLGQSRKCPW